MKIPVLAFCLIFCGPVMAAAGTDAYLDLADQLYNGGLKGVKRVAVLPFAAVESSATSRDSDMVAGRVYSALASRRKFKLADATRTAAFMAGASFRPEKGLEGGLGGRLEDELDADGAVTGLFSDLGDNKLELKAVLIRTSDGSTARSARVIIVRDWAGAPVKAAPEVAPGLRAELRELARKGLKPDGLKQWAEFKAARSGSQAARTRIAELGDRTRQPGEELSAWRAFPDESAARAYIPCSAVDCSGLGVNGGGYYRAYFSDGFTLKVDNSGTVLDFYYPPEQARRALMRARALELRPQAMRGSAGWDDFMKGLSSEPRYGGAGPDAVQTELAKWLRPGEKSESASQACAFAQDYCKRTGIKAAEYLRVSFPDGFTLIMDGSKIANCYYRQAAAEKQ